MNELIFNYINLVKDIHIIHINDNCLNRNVFIVDMCSGLLIRCWLELVGYWVWDLFVLSIFNVILTWVINWDSYILLINNFHIFICLFINLFFSFYKMYHHLLFLLINNLLIFYHFYDFMIVYFDVVSSP
jgi:hypothetical protein